MTTTSTKMRRYHSLDSLRATMMLLGLVIHSAINYMVTPTQVWLYKDQSTSYLFDFILFFIHVFRMPVFFVIAGFFAAFLYYKRGSIEMIKNRLLRVLVPLLLGYIILYPLIISGFYFANAGGGYEGLTKVVEYFQSGFIYLNLKLGHLWFLYDLLLLYGVLLLLVQVAKFIPENLKIKLMALFEKYAVSYLGLLLLIIVTFITLIPMEKAALDTNVTLTPPLRIILAYSVFVVYGWLLFKRKALIDKFSRYGLVNLIIGFALSFIYFVVLILVKVSADPLLQHLVGVVLCSLSMWFLIFGFIGVFVKYFDRPSPIGRYLSDASYWLYLIHLPIAVWLAGAFSGLAISALFKFSIVLILTALITLSTYHFFVRSTLVGWILNGKKYARSLPKFNDLGEYIPHNQPELVPVKTLNQTDLNT